MAQNHAHIELFLKRILVMMMMAMISMTSVRLWIHHLPSFPANTWQVGISEKKKTTREGKKLYN
jgi:hypothetical protein